MSNTREIARFIGDFLEDRVNDAEGNIKYHDFFGYTVIEIFFGTQKYNIIIEKARH